MSTTLDSRRRQLLGAGLAAAGLNLLGHLPAAQAALLAPTPSQSKGPFYPLQLPLDQDNDLVTVTGQPGVAAGEIVNVVGRILDERGKAVAAARVEIWQCDANGRYHHPWDRRDEVPLDPNFQGYGRFITGIDGGYRFRTIKPVSYPGRAPHIHFLISGPGFEPLITQMYVAGAPANERDVLLNSLPDPRARERLLVSFAPSGDRAGLFDIVLMADGRFSR